MTHKNAQAGQSRVLIETFETQFARLHGRFRSLVQATPKDLLYHNPKEAGASTNASVGENLLRAVAVVEQTFGGITANLWDDPFEWTLPENLSSAGLILEYIEEVEATRRRAFACFASDLDLARRVLVPSDEMRSLAELLVDTLVRAAEYHGRALATLQVASKAQVPRVKRDVVA